MKLLRLKGAYDRGLFTFLQQALAREKVEEAQQGLAEARRNLQRMEDKERD